MKPLGTILPTAASLKAGDEAHRMNKANVRIKAVLEGLTAYPMTEVAGERRYQVTSDTYAIISMRTLQPLFFRVTADGTFATRRPSFL